MEQTQVNFRADAALVRRVKSRLALEGRTMQGLLTERLEEYDAEHPDT